MNQDKFSMFVPFDTIEKGKDASGNDVMIIGGVVSDETTGADVDGDILEVEGMDVSKLMSTGFLNWNHLSGKDPSMIIGEPVSYEKKNGKLIVKSKLYPDSEMARKVYGLVNTLKSSNSNRKIGYSIEGTCASRSEKDPRRITKSFLSGLAVAPMPKCKGTAVEIYKGIVNYESLPGSDLLIDITQDGIRYTVDRNLELKKSMEAGSITGRDTANQSTSGEGLKNEDIDGVKKKKKSWGEKLQAMYKRKGLDKDGNCTMSKSEVLSLLAEGGLDSTSCLNVYKLAEAIQKAEFSSKDRKKLAGEGEAEKNGSFPIRNKEDLSNAIQAYGRSKDKEATKSWIKKRAKELDCEDCLPADWK